MTWQLAMAIVVTTMTDPTTTGMDLKVERVRSRVTARSIARVMGVSHQRVAQIEATHAVTVDTAGRFRAAIRQLTNSTENVA